MRVILLLPIEELLALDNRRVICTHVTDYYFNSFSGFFSTIDFCFGRNYGEVEDDLNYGILGLF